MLLSETYKHLTPTAKVQIREELLALCKVRGVRCSRAYLQLLMQGLRGHPCGLELARLISGYIRGVVGIDVSPYDVLGSVKESGTKKCNKPEKETQPNKKASGEESELQKKLEDDLRYG